MAGERHFSTRSVHAGETRDPRFGVTTPITRSAPFVFPTIEELDRVAAKEQEGFEYARMGHPTGRAAEQKIASLESAADAIVTASGMAAVTLTYLALLDAGDHVLVMDDGYKRTLTFARDTLPRWGIACDWFDARDPVADCRRMLRDNTKLVLAEVPSNPHLRMTDIPALAAVCHNHGCLLAIDATIGSPYNLRPLELGADLVIQSATKFLAGHNDVLCGSIAGNSELIGKLRELHANLGASLDPEGCYLLLRGLKTLAVRVERENASALRIATWLTEQEGIKQVFYPGLPDDPGHALAARDMTGFGAMLSFTLDTDLAGVSRFIKAFRLITHGTSLGGVETLALHLWSIMHHSLTAQDARLGIDPDLVRLSVGLEDPEDLIEDLERGFTALRRG